MGFYIDLTKRAPGLYQEAQFPGVLWFLFFFAGGALLLMGFSAHSLLLKMAKSSDGWDLSILYCLSAILPLYFFVGMRLFFLRKFVKIEGEKLQIGYRLGKLKVFSRSFLKHEIQNVELINHRPSSNLAPLQHKDSQYYIRGHWRVTLSIKEGGTVTLDQSTERELLENLYEEIRLFLLRSRPSSL